MEYSLLKITLIVFFLTFFMPVLAVQDVFEYKNKEGVTEFTDELKENKTPESHVQIKKMTPEQEDESKQKLEQIMEKDKELDKRLAREKQLENERRLKIEKQRALEGKQDVEPEDDGVSRINNRNLRPKPVPPIYPGKPRVKASKKKAKSN